MVSKCDATFDTLYNLHCLETCQLEEVLEKDSKIVDLGSGNGIPGIILSILGYQVDLVEINNKKATFLQHITNIINLNCKVINKDIRNYHTNCTAIVSRAVSDIDTILKISKHLINDKVKLVLFKSKTQLDKEIEKAKNTWLFNLQIHPNKYKSNGVIVIISNIKCFKEE